ncbi:MAG: DUF2304 domain-containing protein [Sulfuricellaceae bacterium]|nr:DUF2304 domain-containing protein [Sulfuricellaceae bacterium]
MIGYQLLSAGLGLALATLILFLVRRDHIQIRYALWWLVVALLVLVFGFYPPLIDKIAKLIGVGYPPTLLMLGGIAAMIIKMLYMDIEHSRQEREIRRLAQQLAIWEYDSSIRSSDDQE